MDLKFLLSLVFNFISNKCKQFFNFFARVDVILAIKLMLDCNFWGVGTLIQDLFYNCPVKRSWTFGDFRHYGLHIWIFVCSLMTLFYILLLFCLSKFFYCLSFFIAFYIHHFEITLSTYEEISFLMRNVTYIMYIVKTIDHQILFYKIVKSRSCLVCEKSKTIYRNTDLKSCKCVCRKCARLLEECNLCQMIDYK